MKKKLKKVKIFAFIATPYCGERGHRGLCPVSGIFSRKDPEPL